MRAKMQCQSIMQSGYKPGGVSSETVRFSAVDAIYEARERFQKCADVLAKRRRERNEERRAAGLEPL